MKTNEQVVEHAEKYDGDWYKAAAGMTEDKAATMYVPNPEIINHLPIIRDMASKADRILELGPFMGTGSTMAIRQGVEQSGRCERWVSVDIVDHICPWLKPQYPWWYLVIGDSADQHTVTNVSEWCVPHFDLFDLVFIDTVHTYDHLKKELEIWSQLAAPNCTWLFHDTWMLGQYNPMTDAIKEFAAENPQWEYADVSKKCNGLGALIPVG